MALDFGAAAFSGAPRWLQIAARPNGPGAFTSLSPRQAVTATPYAVFARSASNVAPAAITGSALANDTVVRSLNGQTDAVALTAGAGLNLPAATTLAVSFGGTGASNAAARSDHGHFGANWPGTSATAGLTLQNGSAAPNASALSTITSGTNGYGVRAQQGAGIGVPPRRAAIAAAAVETIGLSASSRDNVAVFADSDNDSAIYAWNHSFDGFGNAVTGYAESADAIYGYVAALAGTVAGVHGHSASTNGEGVFGQATATTGTGIGVHGYAVSPDGIGVQGKSATLGVFGLATAPSGTTYGVAGASDAIGGIGVQGEGDTGVYGLCTFTNGNGVIGHADAGTDAAGVWGRSTAGYAGWFDGKVRVNGTLSKSAGSFTIDHPLDPANQYLQHSFVESPDMKNLYDGVATLDAHGATEVTLPDWFEALNRDFRYQLTALGKPAPDLHVAQEVYQNRFTIAGGTPGQRISWQVTGTRHDAYAEAHRIAVEVPKPAAERGTYLSPVEHGQPAARGLSVRRAQVAEPAAAKGTAAAQARRAMNGLKP